MKEQSIVSLSSINEPLHCLDYVVPCRHSLRIVHIIGEHNNVVKLVAVSLCNKLLNIVDVVDTASELCIGSNIVYTDLLCMLLVSKCQKERQTHKQSFPPAITPRILKVCLSNLTGLPVIEFRAEMLRVRPSIVVFICPIATVVLLLTSVRSWRRGISGVAITFE